MRKNKSKKLDFNKVVGIVTIVGVIATVIFGVIQSFSPNSDGSEIYNSDITINQPNNKGNVNQYNVEGDLYQYDLDGDLIVVTHNNNFDDDLSNYTDALLYQRLKDYVDDDILCFIQDDFDDDGNEEAFAFVGQYSEELETWKGIPYFINKEVIRKLNTDTRTGYPVEKDDYWATYKEIQFGGNKAVAFSLYYATGASDELYGVKNGELIHYKIPVLGDLNVTDNFITVDVVAHDSIYIYDENFSPEKFLSGHTCKPYYFFWNEGTQNFSEYGGTEISLEQLKKVKDVSKIIEQYESDGYSISNILYRANGIININFEPTHEFGGDNVNLTLYIKNYDSPTIEDSEILEKNWGIYQKAINPSIAVYADFPYD